MQGSDIYINTYVSWTLNSNFTYLVIWYEVNCLWRVTLLIQIVENKVIVALFLLTVEFFLIFLIPCSPSLSSLAPHDSSVFTDSLKLFDVILCQASDQSVRVLSGRSQVLNFNFSKCESFLTTINDTLNPQQICYHSSTARKKSVIEKIILQNALQATSWNIFRNLKNE